MKNLLKKRIVVGLICIITALVICFGLTPMFNDALKSKVELERGDIVSLIASDVGEQRKTVIPTELQYLEIIATTTGDGNDNNVQETPKDGEDAELASTITVLATPEQARLLAELEQTGKLHAALVYRGGSENAQKFLDEQAKVLGELYPKAAAESEETADESKILTAHRHRLPVKFPTPKAPLTLRVKVQMNKLQRRVEQWKTTKY